MQRPTPSGAARIPVATYRLQFNAAFTFSDARDIVVYLHDLGISDVYASSYLCAVPGSTHGYDVADPTRLNPEIGSDDDYWRWIGALRERGMGHVLDLVPNHMGIARAANPWWIDVLENGPSSRYARFFDITWQPLKQELHDKLLIPTLGDQYGAVLERQELTLRYRDGAFIVEYFDDWFPVAPDTFGQVLTPALLAWTTAEPEPDPADADELRSIITAAEHLPPRGSREIEQVTTRAREKEILKRRLAALVDRCDALRAQLDLVLTRVNGTVDDSQSFDALDALLGEQSYRLAHWRTASEEINYRRFFDVNQLAALRMEDPAVFAEVHRFVFDLLARGAATGIRVDHVDGLFSPGEYLRRLQRHAAEALGVNGSERPLYLVVEKILGAGEHLPDGWPVHGTTGYEFAAMVNALFVDARNARAFDRVYQRVIGNLLKRMSFDDLAYECRKRIMHETMSGDINSIGHQLNRFSERNRHFRDFTLYSLIAAIREVIACFPVYRTYLTDPGPQREEDRRHVARAVHDARERSAEPTPLVFDFVKGMLLQEAAAVSDIARDERRQFAGKFQQITGPIAAKGIEDTALYVYNRLLSLNEVGADPTRFGQDPSSVHDWMATRSARWPSALSTTSTHDTKRGEDVRARLNVLSELPGDWKAAVRRWRALNRRHKRDVEGGAAAPDANEEYFIYQTLLGAWPFEASEEAAFPARMKEYMVKALREAKVNTSWLRPDEAYEQAVLGFLDRILDPRRPFLSAFRPFQQRIAALGVWNSLSQLLVKCTAPGVPDFYQGTELWDLSLVDPDNRRPVDYSRRRRALDEIRGSTPTPAWIDSLFSTRYDGRLKLFVLQRALAARHLQLDVFRSGDYIPISTIGERAASVFAFARVHASGVSITCVPRLIASLPTADDGVPRGRVSWGDTALILPPNAAEHPLTNVFTGETLAAARSRDRQLEASVVFERFPVALLTCST